MALSRARGLARVLQNDIGSMKTLNERLLREDGAVGYIFMWLLGVPASVLFVIFLLRGCN